MRQRFAQFTVAVARPQGSIQRGHRRHVVAQDVVIVEFRLDEAAAGFQFGHERSELASRIEGAQRS